MDLFAGVFITFNCPRCGYAMDVELVSVHLEAMVFCPCCKATVQLLDSEASMHGARVEMNSAIKDFRNQLKKLSNTIEVKI